MFKKAALIGSLFLAGCTSNEWYMETENNAHFPQKEVLIYSTENIEFYRDKNQNLHASIEYKFEDLDMVRDHIIDEEADLSEIERLLSETSPELRGSERTGILSSQVRISHVDVYLKTKEGLEFMNGENADSSQMIPLNLINDRFYNGTGLTDQVIEAYVENRDKFE